MDLSNDLISKFVKITNDDKNENSESTVYGTVVEYNGGMYVRIDGSDLLTPVETTADFKPNERVTVMIKNHSATVTGNITSPATNEGAVTEKVTKAVEDVEGKVITEVEILIADRVSTKQLDAEVARIDELIAGKASVEDLTATNAEITNLKAKDAEIENLVAGKASIDDLTATNAEITNLKAKDAEIENLVADKARIEDLTATNARIDSLQANKADITYLDANFATIDELEAAHADIEILDAELADINTLVNGNLTSDNILSLNITSQNTTMENAFVKDAMIDTVTANKIMSGTIDTNNVTIKSTDGSMLLQGTLLQMKDDNGKVRIQIGKDTGGNFTFILYDESGTGVLIDEEGIKSSDAIADGLIVDAKVADNANIAGSKLDIASVITEVNNDNSTTIKSNKIYLDEQGQSLEVAFNSLKTHVDTIQDVTIDGDLTSVIEQVQSNTTKIEANKEGISTLVSENTSRKEEIQNLDGEIESVNSTLSSKYSSLEQDISGFKTTVADTYTTKSEFNNLQIGGTNLLPKSGNFKDNCGLWVSNGSTMTLETVVTYNGYNSIKIDNNSSEGIIYNDYITLKPNTTYTYSITAAAAGIVTGDNNRPLHMWVHLPGGHEGNAHHEEILDSSHAGIDTKWGRSYIVFKTPDTDNFYVMKPFIYLTEGQIIYIANFKVEEGNRPTDWSPAPEDIQGQIDATNANIQNNYSTTSQMNSAIQQKANEITSTVSQTYTTKSEFNSLQIGGTNLIQNGNFKGAIAGSTSMPDPWTFWSDEIHIYGSHGLPGYNHDGCVYIGCNLTDGRQAGMYSNDIHVSKVEKGATYMASFIFAIETNVKGATAQLEYLNDARDQILHTQILTTARASSDVLGKLHEHQYHIPFTMWTGDFSYIRIVFNHGGTNVVAGGYLMIVGNVQIEKGNKATDWSPAPEDVQGQIDATNNNLANNYSTTTQMNSAIQQKANEITSSVSQTYTTKSETTAIQNQITTSRNLLMGSRDYNLGKWGTERATILDEWYNGTRIYTTSVEWASMDYYVSDLIDRGVIELFTPYTFSCYVMSTGSDYTPNIQFFGDGLPNYHSAFCGTASTSWQRVSITIEWSSLADRSYGIRFEAPTASPNSSSSYLKWACFQLERGRVATGWAPAPEDAQYGINEVNNNLVNNYSTTSAMNSAIQQKANEITSSVSQTYTTKAEFNNLEVGGTNLIYNGGFNRNLDGWYSNGSFYSEAQACTESPSGYMIRMDVTAHGHGVYQVCVFPDSTYCTDYVVSFYAKTNVDGSQMYVSMEGDHATSSVFTLNGGWQKCVYKFRRSNPGSNAIVFYASGGGTRSIYIHSIMMEKGTVPSAWSPHPSEIENKVDNLSNNLAANYSTTSAMNSAIQQKANEITSSVSQTYATKQSVTDVNNNLVNNYSTTSQMNSAIQQKANEITSSVGQTYITKSEASLINDTVAGNRKWLFEMYTNNQYVGTGGGTFPTLAHLANETLISSRLVDGLPGYTSAIGDYYIGVYTVYLYYESAYTWSGYIISDDESTTYLNGVAVCQAASCTQTPFTMNFKKGINKLQIIHGEGGGGDGVTLSDLGPWKEYGAYPACVTAASSNYYASNSDIVQTVNDLTIKFTESGGYNLLQNGHADKGTSYWNNNGGGITTHADAGGGATGNFFGTSFPHGISYYDWVKLLPNTHYVYQAKIWSNASFGGNSNVPLHYWFSYDTVNNTGDGYTILDYQQNVSYTGTWTQCYIHFVTGNNNIYIRPFIYHNGVTTDIFVTELMLSQSRVVQPWSPHPSEVYSGITRIDKDGVTVYHNNANSNTRMTTDGFFINNNGTAVVQVTSNGLYVQGNITSGSTIQGARISGSTFNSSNDVFQVLEDGTIETSFLAVNGAVSTDKLNVNDIENASYPKVLSEATTVYISPNGGVNAEEFYDGAYFTSLSNMLAVAPRNLNGYTLTIRMMGDLYENAALSWFHSGQVNFEMQGYTLYGYFYGYGASMCYRLYGNTNANNNGTWGHIKPNVGRALGSYYYAVQFQYCQFAVNYVAVYPSSSSGSNSGGISAHRGATGIIFNAKACGDMRYLVRAEYAGRVHVNSSEGACNNATFCASNGGMITLNSSNKQAGRSTSGNPYWVGSGGLILCDQALGMDKITFNNTAQSGSSSSSGSTTRKVTETVKATSADTYRSTVYNSWKGDGTVRQGDYGYGNCQGCWFFGNNLYTTMNAGTVTKVVIRMQRQSGGVNAAQTLTVKSHNHTSRPSGAPTYTDTIGTCSCAVGSYIDLVITDSTTINKLKKCKGLGLSIGSASSPYAVCSGACSVIITYTTNS